MKTLMRSPPLDGWRAPVMGDLSLPNGCIDAVSWLPYPCSMDVVFPFWAPYPSSSVPAMGV